MVVLLERPPEGQNLPAAVAPSIGPVAPDQGVASQVGVFQAGIRPTGDIQIPLPEGSISSQSPLYTEKDYQDAVDRMTGSFRDNGVDGQTVSEIVHDMNGLRDGDAEMMASVQNAADDIQNGNLNQEDRKVWEIIIDALKNITPEQRNNLLTEAGITYGVAAGFWLTSKYFDRLKLSPKQLQIAGTVLSLGSIACFLGGKIVLATQTAPAPDGSSPSPAPTSPDMTPSQASNATAPAPNATPRFESATPGSPDGYSPSTLLGNKDAYNTVAEAIDQSGQPITETANSKYIKAHKFSEADLQAIVDSGSPQYGITVDIARNTLENMTLMKNLTTVNVPGSRVYYFYNGLSGNDSRGFMLLVSADGNSVWQAKNKATGALNHFPNTFSGIDLSNNYTPEQLAQFVRPWQPADTEPQETDRLITQVDISTIGGIDQLNVVFQQGTENAFLVGTTNQVKSGIDVVKSVFDSSTGQWLEIVDLPKDAILRSEWAAYTAEGENKGKYNPEMFFQLVGSINHQNRKTLALESDGLKIAFTVAEQYFIDAGIDPILGLTALSEADQQALAEALSLQLDNIPELKAQLEAIRAQIAANEGGLFSPNDISKYTVIVNKDGQVTGLAYNDGQNVARRYTFNTEGKLVLVAPENEPQLLPELRVNGPYIERTDTGEKIIFGSLNVTGLIQDSGTDLNNMLDRGLATIIKERWNINLLRVSIDVSKISQQTSTLDSLINLAERNGMYVLLNPQYNKKPYNYLPDQYTADIMGSLADRYKNKSHVLYQTWNEAAPEEELQRQGVQNFWEKSRAYSLARERQTLVAEAIRQKNPKAIVVVSGLRMFGNDLLPYISNPFVIDGKTDGIIYDAHLYGDYPSDYAAGPQNITPLIGIFPVAIFETGYVSDGSRPKYNTLEDAAAIIETGIIYNRIPGQVQLGVWAVDDNGPGGVGIFTNNNPFTQKINRRGAAFYYLIQGGAFHLDTPPDVITMIKEKISNGILTIQSTPTGFIR